MFVSYIINETYFDFLYLQRLLPVLDNLKWTRETTEAMCWLIQHCNFISPPLGSFGPATYNVSLDNVVFDQLIILSLILFFNLLNHFHDIEYNINYIITDYIFLLPTFFQNLLQMLDPK